MIGASGAILEMTDPKVVLAANGGSDLIYVPDGNYDRIKQIVSFLTKQDYVGGEFAGALPVSSIRRLLNPTKRRRCFYKFVTRA